MHMSLQIISFGDTVKNKIVTEEDRIEFDIFENEKTDKYQKRNNIL